MALRNEEVIRLKYELGYNITGVGAEVYITYVAVFDKAVQPYLIDVSTTSSTQVSANAAGAPVIITVASNPVSTSSTQTTAFAVGSNVVIDVGAYQETSTITYINGLQFSVFLYNAHNGTYPVVLQGAEQIVRDLFSRLDNIKAEMLNTAPRVAGVAQVDEMQFHAAERGRRKIRNRIDDLVYQREIARLDLAGALGIPYLRPMLNGTGRGGGSVGLY